MSLRTGIARSISVALLILLAVASCTPAPPPPQRQKTQDLDITMKADGFEIINKTGQTWENVEISINSYYTCTRAKLLPDVPYMIRFTDLKGSDGAAMEPTDRNLRMRVASDKWVWSSY